MKPSKPCQIFYSAKTVFVDRLELVPAPRDNCNDACNTATRRERKETDADAHTHTHTRERERERERERVCVCVCVREREREREREMEEMHKMTRVGN